MIIKMQPRRMRVLSVTDVRRDLLTLIQRLDRDGPLLITRNDSPAAVLQGSPDLDNAQRSSAVLVVLGAKPCPPGTARKSIALINRSSSGRSPLFSKVIFVHGPETSGFADLFTAPRVRTVLSRKSGHPLITSVKSALSALSPGDTHFIISFLSSPTPARHFIALKTALRKTRKGILVLQRNGSPIHPIVFSMTYKKHFLRTRKELGIPYIIRRFRNDIQNVRID